MKIPEILNVLGYEVIEQKDGFITLPVEDIEKIETALAVGLVKPPVEEVQEQTPAVEEQAPAVEEQTPAEKKPTKAVEPTHGDNYPYYS